MENAIMTLLLALASASASASPVDVSKDFRIDESRSGPYVYVDYFVSRPVGAKEEKALLAAALKDACRREDVKHGLYPTVNAVFGKKAVPVPVNADSCGK